MMRRLLVASILLFAVTLGAGIEDYLTDMKTTKKQVEDFIEGNVRYGSFSFPAACSLIPTNKRAALVRAVGEYARTFLASDAFKKIYDEFREEQKPRAPELLPMMAEARKKQLTEMKAALATQESAAAKAPPDQKAMYKDILEVLRKAVKDLENPDKSQDAEMDRYMQDANRTATEEYQKKVVEYERDYPKGDPRPLVKKRLQAVLEATKNVDFTAKLVKKDKVMVFAKEEYENKDGNWKLAYRAGKEATEAARTFAQEWLKGL
jgi:hypothetical protein